MFEVPEDALIKSSNSAAMIAVHSDDTISLCLVLHDPVCSGPAVEC